MLMKVHDAHGASAPHFERAQSGEAISRERK